MPPLSESMVFCQLMKENPPHFSSKKTYSSLGLCRMYRLEEVFDNCLSSHICLIKVILSFSYFITPFVCLLSGSRLTRLTCPCHCHRLFASAAETTCTIVHVLYTKSYCEYMNGIHTIQYICMVSYDIVC